MKRNNCKTLLSVIVVVLIFFSENISAQSIQKNRVIILTDIEADPDDTQSLVRLLLYANEIDIKGIVATTSCWHKNRIDPESIRKVIRAYGKVQPNLLKHESGFPEVEALLGLVKDGFPEYGMLGVGDGKDSEGSDWILKELEKDDDRPLWISVWGGVNTLAQTLNKIKKTKSKAEAKKLMAKLRVYTISDQDDSGIWIRNNFPDLFYIVTPGDDYGSATWNAINSYVKGINNEKISNDWIAQNIQQGHGPLGREYPDVAWGVEGDTPAFLSLIPNGLNVPEHPEWGGWGGRYELYKPDNFSKRKKGRSGVPFEPETRAIWTNAVDNYTPYIPKAYGRAVGEDTVTFENSKVSLWRWRDDFQNDFAARMDWCTTTYAEANHPPVPVLMHPEELTVKSGEAFSLDAFDSTDPDGDNLSFLWFSYPEAGSYKKKIKISAENVHIVNMTAPEVKKNETIHFILKLSDKGSPSLSRYKRVIVNVVPK
ncbi:MAG: DUF1593 domain-containing protein [Flammeovirgaceae bacterium]|nr:DUF1593 domain-containing protein [Flammeovirgaceae bacterium]